MAHRSTFSRAALAALVLLACGAVPAAAAQKQIPVPAGAPVVAGPTPSGATLVAFVDGTRLCAVLLEHDTPRPRAMDAQDCDELPVLAPLGHHELRTGGVGFDVPRDVGVTGTDVAAVEQRRGGHTLAHVATQPSPLPGAAADLRFYLLEPPADAHPDELALLDAAGVVRRAEDESEDDVSTGSGGIGAGDPTAGGGTTIARGGRGATRWTLTSRIARLLTPTPLEPERRVPVPCLTFAVLSGASSSSCQQEALAQLPLDTDVGIDCAPIGAHVTVLVRADVRRAVLVLGDGRREAIALHRVPGASAGTRAGVAVLGVGVAVRRVVALGPGGRVLLRDDERLAPAPRGANCGFVSFFGTYSLGGEIRTLGAPPHALRVRDDGPRICVTADAPPAVPGDCRPAPIEADDAWLERWPTAGGGGFVAGVVPVEVASARVALDDGTTLDAPAVPIAGYDGRYRDLLRAVGVDVPPGRLAVGFALRDARGRTLQEIWGAPQQPPLQHRTTLLRRPGLPPLRTALRPRTGTVGPSTCLTLSAEPDACGAARAGLLAVVAQCAPRRIVVYGLLGHRADRLALRTRDGREIAAAVAPLPAAIDRDAAGALAVAPAGTGLRGLVIRGRGAAHADVDLPPAARQCGYQDWVALNRGRR